MTLNLLNLFIYYLNVSPIGRHKLFINVRAGFADTTLRGIHTTSAANLQQKTNKDIVSYRDVCCCVFVLMCMCV